MADPSALANAVRYGYTLTYAQREEIAKALERLAQMELDALEARGSEEDMVRRIAALEAELAAERAKHQRELEAALEATAYRSDQLDAERTKSAERDRVNAECIKGQAKILEEERAKSARYEASLRALISEIEWHGRGDCPGIHPRDCVEALVGRASVAAEALTKAGSPGVSPEGEDRIAELEEKIAKTRAYADSSGGSSGGSCTGSGGTNTG